jgi:hypothetical protein
MLAMLNFRNTVSALTYTMIQDHFGQLEGGATVANKVSAFVACQIKQMPDYMSPVVYLLTLMFDAFPLIMLQAPFHRLDNARRQELVSLWQQSPMPLTGDFVKLYQTLVVFGWYAQYQRNH